jgi:hypothetical protein
MPVERAPLPGALDRMSAPPISLNDGSAAICLCARLHQQAIRFAILVVFVVLVIARTFCCSPSIALALSGGRCAPPAPRWHARRPSQCRAAV